MSRIEDNCQFNEDFIKNYNEESDEGYSFEVYVQYLQKLLELHNDLPFLPERMKIKKSQKIAANLHDKTEYVIRIRNLKQVLNHELVLKKGHSEGTSSVAFEVLIMNCQIYFLNLFIFNCLILNITLFMFSLFEVKFLFSEIHIFSKQENGCL